MANSTVILGDCVELMKGYADGYFDFYELYSGEYYIKPLLKEYKFDPAQKQINIVGGEHYEEIIVAHRFAFSVYGKVNNLNKEKVDGVSIQAVNIKTQQITETLLDKNNEYRTNKFFSVESVPTLLLFKYGTNLLRKQEEELYVFDKVKGFIDDALEH